MRQLNATVEEKAMMLDIIMDNIENEYNLLKPVEKAYHSRAEKIGYRVIEELNNNGFMTTAGIHGK